ncbi:MAG: alkaline phosphatase [Bythopirellula sp.]|nr:alkaline phosphatase [Bythopirellula sp.]
MVSHKSLAILIISLCFVSCLATEPTSLIAEDAADSASLVVQSPAASSPLVATAQEKSGAKKIRNVILMIGDGMGPQQMGLLFAYARHAPGSKVPKRIAAMEQMAIDGELGMVRTEPYGSLVVDSAAAATQLATGKWSDSEMIGVDFEGNSAATVVEIARDLGKATGLVSDTRLTHATPAAFAAHQRDRSMENEIAVDMLENKVDVLLSGGLRYFVPQAVNDKDSATYDALVQMMGGAYEPYSRREDNRNLLLEARDDYKIVFDHKALAEVKAGKVLGLFGNSEMLDAIGENKALKQADRTEPTLVEMTEKALELLSQDPDGFFLMVEGGQIDWGGHNNDAGVMLQELLQFDDAIRVVLNWARERDDTLVLVTADHETGSFGFSYSGKDLPEPRQLSGKVFGDEPFIPNFNYAPHELLDNLAAQQKSFFELFTEFDALPEKLKTAETLVTMVNESVAPYSITLEDATKILTRTTNRNYKKGHAYLGTKTVPQMPDQQDFFVYGENLRFNRLGHILGAQQHVVWGTGTHTNTPVAIISHGPGSEKFSGLMHATDVGQRMIELVKGE